MNRHSPSATVAPSVVASSVSSCTLTRPSLPSFPGRGSLLTTRVTQRSVCCSGHGALNSVRTFTVNCVPTPTTLRMQWPNTWSNALAICPPWAVSGGPWAP